MKNNLSIFNNLRPITVGFDNMFDHFEHMMDDSFFGRSVANFPPYNIVKTGENTYDVELALAGFNKKDIEIEYKENVLTVKSKKQEETKDEDGNIIHRGICLPGAWVVPPRNEPTRILIQQPIRGMSIMPGSGSSERIFCRLGD